MIRVEEWKRLMLRLGLRRLSKENQEILFNYAKKYNLNAEEFEEEYDKYYEIEPLLKRAKYFNESDTIAWWEFYDFIERMDYRVFREEKKKLYRFFADKGMTKNEVFDLFNGARKFAIISQNKLIKFSDVVDVIDRYNKAEDLEFLKNIKKVDRKFKRFCMKNGMSTEKIDEVMKNCWQAVMRVMLAHNKTLVEDSAECAEMLFNMACLYNELAFHLPKYKTLDSKNASQDFLRDVDQIMVDRFTKLAVSGISKLNEEQVKIFAKFLDELMYGAYSASKNQFVSRDELFSKEEVAEFLNDSISLFGYTNERKLENVRRVINLYIDNVLKMADQAPTLKDFSKITTKSVFMRSGMITRIAPKTLLHTVKLLSGETASQVFANIQMADIKTEDDAKRYLLKKAFPNLKISIDVDTHYRILTKKTSVLIGLTHNTLYKTTRLLVESAYEGLGLPAVDSIVEKKQALDKLGFDIENFYNQDNISEIFVDNKQKESDKTNLVANFNLLSKLVKPSDIKKIAMHNFDYITKNNGDMLKDMQILLAGAKTIDEVKSKLEAYFNQKMRKKSTTPANNVNLRTKRMGARESLNKEKIELESLDIDVEALKTLGINLDGQILVEKKPVIKKPIIKKAIEKKSKQKTTDTDIQKVLKFIEENPQAKEDEESQYIDDEELGIPTTKTQQLKKEEHSESAYSVMSDINSELINLKSMLQSTPASWLADNANNRGSLAYLMAKIMYEDNYQIENQNSELNGDTLRMQRYRAGIATIKRFMTRIQNLKIQNEDVEEVVERFDEVFETADQILDKIIAKNNKAMEECRKSYDDYVSEKKTRKPSDINRQKRLLEQATKAREELDKEDVSDEFLRELNEKSREIATQKQDYLEKKIAKIEQENQDLKEAREYTKEVVEEYTKLTTVNDMCRAFKSMVKKSSKHILTYSKDDKVDSTRSDVDPKIREKQAELASLTNLIREKEEEIYQRYIAKKTSNDYIKSPFYKRLMERIEELKARKEELEDDLESLTSGLID